ncbi:MAG: DUF3014 domain-containing protein [Thermoanaerobaculia bacterium]
MEPLRNDYDSGGPPGPRKSQGMPWWPAALIALVLIAAVGWYFWSRRSEAPPAVASTPEPAPAPAAPVEPAAAAPEEWDLPDLGESDDFLRDVAARLSSHPEWLAWIATDDLVRRFVGSVDEVARGELPAAQLGFLVPERGFYAATRAGSSYLDGSSFERFDRLASVVSGIDAGGAVDLFARLEPLLQEAYRDLGYPSADFEETLAKAVMVVMATPEQEQPPLLAPAVSSFKFADPDLESLPPVQKLILRMGPENGLVVKRKLREISAELDHRHVTSQPEAD